MDNEFLKQEEIKEIVVFHFFLIQMLVNIDYILSKVMTKVMWNEVQEVLKLDFNQKIDSVYAILKRSLNRKGWEDLQLGKNNSVFTPKLLKSVLMELSRIRNQFAHMPIFYDDIKGGVTELGPGIIKLFLNFGEVDAADFPLKLKFNEKLLERKALIKISMGSIYGLESDKFQYAYTKKDTHFKGYTDLFRYAEILSQYSFRALTALDEMLNELMGIQKKSEKQ